ncbi:MAG: hypothetical protein ACRDRK_08700 [Pseudonocardia sp.]
MAVILAAAACDTAAGRPDAPATDDSYGSSSYGAGHSEHTGHPVVVPVGNTTEPGAPPEQGDEPEDDPDQSVEKEKDEKEKDDEEKDGEKPTGEKDEAKPEDKSATKINALGDDCSDSELDPHDGFQKAQRCVSTAFGEVAQDSPSLLITSAPTEVKSGEEFPITVSTRNLVRDRFLKAADGGYYAESSFLNPEGLQRGHFHTACRMLTSTDVAPDAEPVPAFFVATEDDGGGTAPDSVTVTVTGLTEPGTAQCAAWAGDGSHRVPMMVRANQTPAFDVVRIAVR